MENTNKMNISMLLTSGVSYVIAVSLIIYTLCEGGEDVNVGIIAIAVAMVGVASGWIQVVQFKKDAQRISNVNATSNKVKEDTTEIRPAVNRIEGISSTIKDNLLGGVLPNMDKLKEIDKLVQEIEIEKGIRQKVSKVVGSPDYIIQAIHVVYQENARLHDENQKLSTELELIRQEDIRDYSIRESTDAEVKIHSIRQTEYSERNQC